MPASCVPWQHLVELPTLTSQWGLKIKLNTEICSPYRYMHQCSEWVQLIIHASFGRPHFITVIHKSTCPSRWWWRVDVHKKVRGARKILYYAFKEERKRFYFMFHSIFFLFPSTIIKNEPLIVLTGFRGSIRRSDGEGRESLGSSFSIHCHERGKVSSSILDKKKPAERKKVSRSWETTEKISYKESSFFPLLPRRI